MCVPVSFQVFNSTSTTYQSCSILFSIYSMPYSLEALSDISSKLYRCSFTPISINLLSCSSFSLDIGLVSLSIWLEIMSQCLGFSPGLHKHLIRGTCFWNSLRSPSSSSIILAGPSITLDCPFLPYYYYCCYCC